MQLLGLGWLVTLKYPSGVSVTSCLSVLTGEQASWNHEAKDAALNQNYNCILNLINLIN